MSEYARFFLREHATVEEIKAMSRSEIRTEIATLCFTAARADNGEVLAEAEMLAMDPDPQPERIVELWNQLRSDAEDRDRELRLKAAYKEGEL